MKKIHPGIRGMITGPIDKAAGGMDRGRGG